ncbi:MAG TPA: glycosyltransferase family 4 protein [Syntrophales bacterium]|nr:glycosyltransferase family 4 protein [Syntrophales bacterium]
MRVLMFGWEFPPHISGGLGTACFGITKALTEKQVEIVFVLPRIKGVDRSSHVTLLSASEIPLTRTREVEYFGKGMDFRPIDSILRPYIGEEQYMAVLSETRQSSEEQESSKEAWREGGPCAAISGDYGPDMMAEIVRYGGVARVLAGRENFDIIHGHDWMTVFAGIYAREVSGKPFILHVHATEFDRSGENVNRDIFEIERFGMRNADCIIAVSHYTKGIIVNRYEIKPEKVSVVHNAVTKEDGGGYAAVRKRPGQKIVLFLGRITFQKGPDYFIEAAARVLKVFPDVTFVMAGTGDMMPRMIERVAELRIGKHFHFLGFISGDQIEQIYAMSDLYVMPSVSEPFGISPLEAMLRDVPVIISRQSGVAEILNNALTVDFWDVSDLANKMIAVLQYPALSRDMTDMSRETLRTIGWEHAAEKIIEVYEGLRAKG